jgi:hypothetical protein
MTRHESFYLYLSRSRHALGLAMSHAEQLPDQGLAEDCFQLLLELERLDMATNTPRRMSRYGQQRSYVSQTEDGPFCLHSPLQQTRSRSVLDGK